MGQFLSDKRTVAVGAVVDNILTGKFSEFLQEDSKVSMAITSSVDALFASLIIGNELLVDGQEINDTNASPRNPDDVAVQGFGVKGDRVIIKLRNGNAAVNVSRANVFIEPI